MKLSEMREVLESGKIRLTKSLGQNFLHDQNQVRRIIQAAEIRFGDRVLEIGPGLGPLTQGLLGEGANVLAVEIDRRLAGYLKKRYAGSGQFELVEGDAVEYVREHRDWSGWKCVSNLPYSVGSVILVELAQGQGSPERLVVTVQLEVARKLMATAGTEDYGLLSLLVQVTYEPVDLFKIPAGCFFPPPDVDSACVTLERRKVKLLPDGPGGLDIFRRIVKRSFSQRRKMMFKLLKEDWPVASLEAAFRQLGLPSDVRGEKLTLEQYVQLTRLLAPGNFVQNG